MASFNCVGNKMVHVFDSGVRAEIERVNGKTLTTIYDKLGNIIKSEKTLKTEQVGDKFVRSKVRDTRDFVEGVPQMVSHTKYEADRVYDDNELLGIRKQLSVDNYGPMEIIQKELSIPDKLKAIFYSAKNPIEKPLKDSSRTYVNNTSKSFSFEISDGIKPTYYRRGLPIPENIPVDKYDMVAKMSLPERKAYSQFIDLNNELSQIA